MRVASLSVLLAAVVSGVYWPTSVAQQPDRRAWQVQADSRTSVARSADQSRRERIQPAFDVVDAISRDRGVVLLPLPSGRTAAARLDRREEFASGYVTSGPLTDGTGFAAISVVGSTMAGHLLVDGQAWSVRQSGSTHTVALVADTAFAPDGEPIAPDLGGGVSDLPLVPSTSGDGVTVDVMVVYTPAALARYGSVPALTAETNLAIANSNTSFANAGLAHRFNLVHFGPVSYTESGSSNTDLQRLQRTSDGFLDELHAVRDSVGADVVSLFTSASDVCGIAYVMADQSPAFADYAFSVVIATCAAGNLTLAHEVGHNMGLQHNVEDAGFQGVTSYAYGHRVPGVARTVMAYACPSGGPACPRNQVYSSPLTSFSGGVAAGVADAADNARALNLTFATVAAFRTVSTPCTFDVSPTSASIGASAGTIRVTVTTTSSCAWDTDVGATGIVATPSTSQGSGYVDLAYPANSGATRQLVVSVAGEEVVLTQTAACVVSLSGSPLSFTWAGGTGSLTVTVASECSDGWTVVSSQPWLSFSSAASGTVSGSVSFAVAQNIGITPTQRSAVVTLTSGVATATVTVVQTPPTMTVSPAKVLFGATRDSTIVHVTPEQEIPLTWSGPSAPQWTVTLDATTVPTTSSWLTMPTTSGSGSGQLRMSVNSGSAALIGQDVVVGRVRITASGYAALDVPVALRITSLSQSLPPTGRVDSPAEGASGLTGALAMGGWALDDTGVDRVEIYRVAVAGDPPAAVNSAGLVLLVARAVFVSGARPDVLAAFGWNGLQPHGSPHAQRAGWGVQVLTNALPHLGRGTPTGGQGTFTLVVRAVDLEGRTTELGRRTITVDNDIAVVPFGTIDTPIQGGPVPGASAPYDNLSSYPVFGWALSPGGACIPPDGSTIDVLVDGVVVGHPTYGLARSDIATKYPGYCNSAGAVGVYYLNASGLSDGLHTLAWRVRDDLGRVTGIGSRHFRVSHGSITRIIDP